MFKLHPLVAAISFAMIYPMAALASDTGDAPASYGLATHEIVVNGPQIGEVAPDDNDPINSVGADGDDNGGATDDEDGVFAFPVLVEYAKAYTTNVFVSNASAEDATLVGWVDFDGNGTFDADEAATAVVPAGSDNARIKLLWPDTHDVTTGYTGTTYSRFRVTTDAISANDALGGFSDGEVEDYSLTILQDYDGDEIPDISDLDNDNDGIPDAVEDTTTDTDNDGTPNYLDVDSDDDSIPDYAEAGPDGANPMDTDNDGTPDYLDTDSNNDGTLDSAGNAADTDYDGILDSVEGSIDTDGDGIINSEDLDSDNDIIPDSVEIGFTAPVPVDTDGDLIPDYLDLDSDNDGIPDIYESNNNVVDVAALDTDNDGAVDSGQIFGNNGLVDDAERGTDSGIPIYAVPDSDADGVRDFRDLDSDNDGAYDVIESGGADVDNNGLVDPIVDVNENRIPDGYDVTQTGGADTNGNGIDDVADTEFVSGTNADNDSVLDTFDLDPNGDGIIDGVISSQLNDLYTIGFLSDLDDDNIPDYRDDDIVGGVGSTGTTVPTNTTPEETPDTPSTNGIVETGLTGTACSISGTSGNDPLFPGLLLLSSLVVFLRRKFDS